jgi:imidazole glycerol-phosphate synthase subunit HisH
MKKICILDYGLGNIKSLYNSLRKIGYYPKFYSEDTSNKFDIIFIPGVGSYSKASKLLLSPKFKNFINEARKNSYLFGICLGMQILLSKGFENGEHEGLDLINGEVKLIGNKNQKVILPFVGYHKISIVNDKAKFLNQYNNQKFYFVHSYVANPRNEKDILSYTTYQKIKYCSSIAKGQIIGTQFHPEKSGEIGLNFLKDFIKNC